MYNLLRKNEPDEKLMNLGEFKTRRKELLEKIDKESSLVQEEVDNLSLFSLKLKYTTMIIALAAITLLFIFIRSPVNFFIYWLVSAFVFLIINPFIFLLPTGRERSVNSVKVNEFSAKGIYNDLKGSLKILMRERKLFAEFGWKLFFINCQPLAPGFIGIFSAGIVFGTLLFVGDVFDRFTYGTLIVQCFAIIVFYTGIWFVKPYSNDFMSGLLGMGERVKENYRSGYATFFKYILIVAVFAAVGGVVMLLALLLPGFTLGRIMEDGSEMEFKVVFFIIVFVSQVILVRYIQGGSSRTTVENFLRVKQIGLETLRNKVYSLETAGAGDMDEMDPETAGVLVSAERSAVEMNLFRTDYHNFAGYFPVCLISPNIKMLLKLYQYYPGKKK